MTGQPLTHTKVKSIEQSLLDLGPFVQPTGAVLDLYLLATADYLRVYTRHEVLALVERVRDAYEKDEVPLVVLRNTLAHLHRCVLQDDGRVEIDERLLSKVGIDQEFVLIQAADHLRVCSPKALASASLEQPPSPTQSQVGNSVRK